MKLPDMKNLTIATRGVTTKSAMNPALWLCALSTPTGFAGSLLAHPPTNYFLLAICTLPLLNAVRAYNHFMKHDPDRLQSERYLLERQVVATLGINGEEGTQILLPDGPKMDNPISHGEV